MSSTNRGAEGREADYYPTPAWTVQRLLDHVELPGGKWLEPGAGDGAIIRAANRSDVGWIAVEIREACMDRICETGAAAVIGDFLTPRPLIRKCGPFAVALGNPPFSLAQEFVAHALTMAEQVVFLLRLSFLESQKRQSLFERIGVPDVFVLPERPSFTGEGTDSCAYAWMRWKADRTQSGTVSILYDKRQLSLLSP